MAYENLVAVREVILDKRKDGPGRLKLHQLVELLKEQYGVVTTAGTLSRYLKETATPDLGLRATTPDEDRQVETAILQIELLAELRGRCEEQRVAIEYLGGQIRVLTETVEMLQPQQASEHASPPPELIRQIWTRAFLISSLTVGGLAVVAILAMR